jgi:hypothetical protein
MLCAAAAVTVAAQSKVAILPPEEEIGILTHSPITDESIGNNTMKEGTIQHYILYASNTIPDALFWLNFFSVFFYLLSSIPRNRPFYPLLLSHKKIAREKE